LSKFGFSNDFSSNMIKKNVDLSSTSGLFGLTAKMLACLRFFLSNDVEKYIRYNLLGKKLIHNLHKYKCIS
jgi:hypothetical protein